METKIKLHEPGEYFYAPESPGYDLRLSSKIIIPDLLKDGMDLALNE